MNRSMLAVLIGALMATGTVQAAAQDNTWYVGGKAGWSNFYGVDYNAQVEELFDATRVNENSDDLGLGLFAGYQVNRNLAVELGYDWLGKYQVDKHYSGNGVDFALDGEAKAQMVQATMKIILPATSALDIYGRLGRLRLGPRAPSTSGPAMVPAAFPSPMRATSITAPPLWGHWASNTPSTGIGPPASNTSTPPPSARPRWRNPA